MWSRAPRPRSNRKIYWKKVLVMTQEILQKTISTSLSSRYGALAARVLELAEPLTQEQFWQKPFPFGNSFGNLVLHLTGNLNYYIGAEIAGTGYVRDRDREFTE